MAIRHLFGDPTSTTRRSLRGRCVGAAILALLAAACADHQVGFLDPGVEAVASMNPGQPGPAGTSVVQVRVATVGQASAQGGYLLRVGEQQRPAASTEVITFPRMAAGPTTVVLESVPAACEVAGDNPRTLEVAPNGLTRTEFQVTCDHGGGVTASPAGATVAGTVGPDGGALEARGEDGSRVVLTIPAGALEAPVEISVTPARLGGLPGTVSSFIGGAILEPTGLEFRIPATLTLAPEGGTAGVRWLAGILVGGSGAPEWFLPSADDDIGTLSMDVPHFSIVAFVEAQPEAWVEFMDVLGAMPRALGESIELRLIPGPHLAAALPCIRVVALLADARPVKGIPVFLEMTRGPSAGTIADELVFTNGDGWACTTYRVPSSVLTDPMGEWVLIVGQALGPPFGTNEQRAIATIALVDDREPAVRLVLPEAPIRSHEPFELCAEVFTVDGSQPSAFAGATVHFPDVRGHPFFGYRFPPLVTGADGRACFTASIDFESDDDAPVQDVPLIAEVRRPDPGFWGITNDVLQDLRRIRHEVTTPVQVGLWSLTLQAPLTVPRDGSAEVCAVVQRGVVLVNGQPVRFRRWGRGLFQGEGAEVVDGAPVGFVFGSTGSAGPGRSCVTFFAPADPENDPTLPGGEETATIEVEAFVLPESRIASQVISFSFLELSLSAAPTDLYEAAATSEICALLRDGATLRPVPGETVTLAVTGPGSLEADQGVTDEAGRACATYTAPSPLPDRATDVEIRADVATSEGTAEATTTVRLGVPFTLGLVATPTSLNVGGGTSQLCSTLRDPGRDVGVSGVAVTFSSAGPGSLFPTSVVTDPDGRACTTYTAPSPLPQGTTDVVITAAASTDAGGVEAPATVRLSSSFPLAILTTFLPAGGVGAEYTTDILAGGGTGPRSWSVSAGALPQGLAFTQVSAQGRISGVPTLAGRFTFTLRVATSTETVEREFFIDVVAPPDDGDGGGGGGGGAPVCSVVLGNYPGGGNHLNPPFSLRARVGGGCGSGTDLTWTGSTRNDGMPITEIPGFSLDFSPVEPDPDNPGGLLGFATVTYDRDLFLSPLYPQREGIVRACLTRNGSPILNDFGEQLCATYRWFN